MKKGNSILLITLVISCTIIAIVIAYGIVNLLLTKTNMSSYEEEFDSLVNSERFNLTTFKDELEESAFLGGLRLDGASAKVILEGNTLSISIMSKSIEYINEMTVSGNIINANWYGNEKLDDITLKILDMVYSMSHESGNAISEYISKSDKDLININNVGLEISDGVIKMRVNKDIDFIDVSSKCITLEEASKHRGELTKEGLSKFGNENVMAIKTGYDGEIIISVAQHGKLSKPAYDSLINILAVALNYDEFYENFVYNHTNYKFKNEENEKYKLEINPIKEKYEENAFSDMEMIRITIFK